MKRISRISLIGSGNVATHLGLALKDAGIKIEFVYSRNLNNAKKLASMLGAQAIDKIDLIGDDSDLYLFAVSDNAIAVLAKKLSKYCGYNIKVAHTSGMKSSEIFKEYFNDFGVFYPLQTFTKDRELTINEIPFCITANGTELENELYRLAESISLKVDFIDDKKRNILHVAAVFANNFTNYLYSVSENILKEEDLQSDYLFPLIKETAAKVIDGYNPSEIQTGPAIRKDDKTIRDHLEYLEKFPEYKNLYVFLTEKIKRATYK